MLATLKTIVTRLEQIESRADKYRSKSGRITISACDFNELCSLTVSTGRVDVSEPVELDFAEFVGLCDDFVAAACDRLRVTALHNELVGLDR